MSGLPSWPTTSLSYDASRDHISTQKAYFLLEPAHYHTIGVPLQSYEWRNMFSNFP